MRNLTKEGEIIKKTNRNSGAEESMNEMKKCNREHLQQNGPKQKIE